MLEWLETRIAPATGSIQGTLWNDLNGDGARQTGEPALVGRTVFLDQNQDGVLDNGEVSTTTGADGSYSFSGLVPGTYYVAEVLPSGWQQSAPGSVREQAVTLTAASSHVFTFDNLATTADKTIGPYHEDGFTFNTSVQGQPSDVFRIYGSTDTVRYAGAPALTSEWAPVTISLTPDNGGPFTLSSIDLSTIWNSIYTPTVTFTGTRADGSQVQQSFTLSNQLGFQTETFTGFTNLTSVTWKSTGTSDYHQFRNVSVTTSGTSTASGIDFGSVQSSVPKAVADSYTTPENTTLIVSAPGILGNDTDPNGLALTPVVTSYSSHGTLTVNEDGSFTYVPTHNFYGTDSFNYYVTDGQANSTYVTDTITVSHVNQPPLAANDAYTLVENTSLTTAAGQTFVTMNSQPGDYIGAGKSYNFTPSGSTITAQVRSGGAYTNTVEVDVSGPAGESWSLDFAAPNYGRLTPGSYTGAVRWPFETGTQPGLDIAGDGRGSNTLTGQFTVLQAVYDASGKIVAFAATFTQHSEGATPALTGEVAYNSSLNQPEGVLFNDSDPDGDPLTAQLVSGPSHGAVTLNADGSFTYAPVSGYYGPDSFTYQANDGQLNSNVATVSLTVYGLPLVVNQAYTANENQSLTESAGGGLLVGATDPNGLSLSASLVAGPAHGAVVVNPDGSFTYTPASGYYGPDSFTYQANDGQAGSSPATVTLTVNAPPVVSNVSYTVEEDGTLTTAAPGVLASASDPDGDALTAVLVANPSSGALTFNADGSFVYQPAAGFSGTDSFTYKANDGAEDSNVATVTIQVNPLAATSVLLGIEGPSSIDVGQSIKLDATVLVSSPGTGTPTGTVTFLDGGTVIGTQTLDSSGFAQFTASALAVGDHSLSAVYNGDANDQGSASQSFAETVNPDPTAVSLSSSAQDVVVGQPVTFTAVAFPLVNVTEIPTGTVTFSDGSTVLGTAALDGTGQATLTTSSLTLGTHAITAVYNGDANDLTSTSSMLSQVIVLDATTTTLTSSASPALVGQSVTFAAAVVGSLPAAGTPMGTVTFADGSTVLGTVPLSDGQATLTTSSLALGSHSITATYGGDAVHQASTSLSLSQGINVNTTTTAIVSSGTPALAGQAVTFTASVIVVAPGAGTPSGTVTFMDHGTVLGSAPLAAASATFTTTTLPAGSHLITAVYNGDANDEGSISPGLAQTVNLNATTTVVTSTVASSVVGQSVTFTAAVALGTPWAGASTPSGTVYFDDGSSLLAAVSLDNTGHASFVTSGLGLGSHNVTVLYGGDSLNASSTSAVLSQSVSADTTTTSVTSSTNPSVFTQSVTLTAFVSVSAPGAGTPSGTVTFWSGTKALSTQGVDITGHASVTIATLPAGNDPITAVYSGDPNELGSSSAALSQVVSPEATTTTITSSPNPSVVGQAVTFTASVAPVAPYFGLATGTVTFYDGSSPIGTGTLNGGVTSVATSALGVGSHSITAFYSGDAANLASTSPAQSQTVNRAATMTTIASPSSSSVVGQAVTFTATVSAVAPGGGAPSGTVTFKDGSTVLGTAPLTGGIAHYTAAGLALGTHSITAVYGGDANDVTSMSSPWTQTVNKDATVTAVTSSANPSVLKQTVTFTASVAVTAPGKGTPTGTVTFKDGNTVLGTVSLVNGVAALTRSNLGQGAHSITAVYSGDANDQASTSTPLSQSVQAATRSALRSSQSSARPGSVVTFTATVNVVSPGTGVPTGLVTFFDGTTVLGTATLNNGVATFKTSTLSRGTHSIYVVYGGDAGDQASTSAALTQRIS
ncbi:MAG: Ig-like domain repeat protein [Isosphaeraceae bacterium]|nr:Ig-like domain repeat protein [Isosphaeraceae bacterium]